MSFVADLTDRVNQTYAPIKNVTDVFLDGQIYRFDQDKRGDKALWVIGHEWEFKGKTYQSAQFGSWKLGDKHELKSWSAKRVSTDFKAEQEKKLKAQKRNLELERQKKHRECRVKWKPIFEGADLAPDPHGYMKRKKIGSNYCAKVKDGLLLIPAWGREGQFVGVQRIQKDGKKRFSTGIEKKGSFSAIPDKSSVLSCDKIYLAEGFATAASVYLATDVPCAVAFDSGNLPAATETLRYLNPGVEIIIAADNDENGVGEKKAVQCTQKFRDVYYKLPMKMKGSDFNDLHVEKSLESVRKQLAPSPQDKFPTMKNGFFIEYVDSNGKDKEMPDYVGFGGFMKEIKHLKTFEHGSYIYNGFFYEKIGRIGLLNQVVTETQNKAGPSQLEQFSKYATAMSYGGNEEPTTPAGMLNVRNGVLDVKSRSCRPHSPKYFFKYVLDTTFDKSKDCPKWKKFLYEVLSGDDELVTLMQEIFGYTILGGDPFLHKAFVFYGEGRNGKSTVLDILQYLLGSKNYSNVPVGNLDKPFSVVNLDGRLANITGELTTGMVASDAFKSAVSGEPLIAAQKGKPEYELPVKCRFFFASNHLPRFGDSSTGLQERLVLIPFKRYFKPQERDLHIKDKLKSEISGIMNWALDGLERLLERGDLMPEPRAVQEQKEEFIEETDSVWAFCQDHVHFSTAAKHGCKAGDLYEAYKAYCEADLKKPVGRPAFGRRFSKWARQFEEVELKLEGSKASRFRVWTNIYCDAPGFPNQYPKSTDAPNRIPKD